MAFSLAGISAFYELEEASGLTRNDSFGTNHLSDVGTVGSAGGKVGNAAVFDGTGKHLARASTSPLVAGNQIAIAAWVFVNDGDGRGVVIKSNGTAAEYYLYTALGAARLYLENGASNIEVDAPCAIGEWQFIVAQWDGVAETARIRVNDGTPVVQSYSGGVLAGSGTFHVGADFGGATSMNGSIDQTGIFKDRILTSEDEETLWNNGDGLSWAQMLALAGDATAVSQTLKFRNNLRPRAFAPGLAR